MYKHEDIDRHHIHIVTVNVNEQGKRLNQAFLFRRSKKITSELEDKYNLHKAQRERVSPDTPITKLDPAGDIKRQLANIVKLVGMRWQFQTLGEYNAILSLYNIRCEATDGKVNGREYHGLVYFATNDAGETIANPFKASRLGKFASRSAVENKFERSATSINLKPSRRIISSVINDSSGKDDFIPNLGRKVLIFSSVRIMMVESMESLSLTTIPIQFSMAHDLAESSRQMPLNVGSTVTVRSLKSQCLISPMYRTGHNRQVRRNQEVQHLQTVLQTIKTIKQVNRHLLTQPTLTNHRFPDWICSSSVPASMPNRRL